VCSSDASGCTTKRPAQLNQASTNDNSRVRLVGKSKFASLSANCSMTFFICASSVCSKKRNADVTRYSCWTSKANHFLLNDSAAAPVVFDPAKISKTRSLGSVCVIRFKPATRSGESCHRFRAKVATRSGRNLPLGPLLVNRFSSLAQ